MCKLGYREKLLALYKVRTPYMDTWTVAGILVGHAHVIYERPIGKAPGNYPFGIVSGIEDSFDRPINNHKETGRQGTKGPRDNRTLCRFWMFVVVELSKVFRQWVMFIVVQLQTLSKNSATG